MPALREIDYWQPEGFRPLSLDLLTPDAANSPDAANAPVIVFLHGGGWLRGSRRVFTPGISDADSFDLIVAAGFAVASCEYRLSGEARFPAQLDDVDAAIDWLHAHGAEHGVDASRLVLWGVSAGATLASLAGLRRDDVRGVVDWFGPADLFAMAAYDAAHDAARDAVHDAARGEEDGLVREAPGETREARWIGGPAAQRPDIARAASPIFRVHPKSPPFHISHGTADENVPPAQSAALADALAAAGADVEFVPVPGGQHFWRGVENTRPLFDRALRFAERVCR